MEDISMRWRQDRENSKLFHEITDQAPGPRVGIHVDHVDFVSPVTGTRLRNNRELVDHNKQHGLSNDLDHLREQTAKANAPKTESKEVKHQRKLAIKDAIERTSSSGYHRQVQYDE